MRPAIQFFEVECLAGDLACGSSREGRLLLCPVIFLHARQLAVLADVICVLKSPLPEQL